VTDKSQDGKKKPYPENTSISFLRNVASLIFTNYAILL